MLKPLQRIEICLHGRAENVVGKAEISCYHKAQFPKAVDTIMFISYTADFQSG